MNLWSRFLRNFLLLVSGGVVPGIPGWEMRGQERAPLSGMGVPFFLMEQMVSPPSGVVQTRRNPGLFPGIPLVTLQRRMAHLRATMMVGSYQIRWTDTAESRGWDFAPVFFSLELPIARTFSAGASFWTGSGSRLSFLWVEDSFRFRNWTEQGIQRGEILGTVSIPVRSGEKTGGGPSPQLFVSAGIILERQIQRDSFRETPLDPSLLQMFTVRETYQRTLRIQIATGWLRPFSRNQQTFAWLAVQIPIRYWIRENYLQLRRWVHGPGIQVLDTVRNLNTQSWQTTSSPVFPVSSFRILGGIAWEQKNASRDLWLYLDERIRMGKLGIFFPRKQQGGLEILAGGWSFSVAGGMYRPYNPVLRRWEETYLTVAGMIFASIIPARDLKSSITMRLEVWGSPGFRNIPERRMEWLLIQGKVQFTLREEWFIRKRYE